ncbi:unnamed protein product [Triticum turgidum subsp. durum]|uniref:peroxidase n=2 Tax=Triticum TaxID=4564 RepID=A0A9R0WSF5_TRITD|nr:unnamed protein product [Triticum turgidum subsp. durum]
MGAGIRILAVALLALAAAGGAAAQLRQGYYSASCPNVEAIVQAAVALKVQQTPVAVGATVRLFFHDCFVQGCDASVIIVSTANNTAEKDHVSNLSLAGDGFDTVIKAKAAVDTQCPSPNLVSCADILTMATRDVIGLAGGPAYPVELGRLDGLVSTASNVDGNLPPPSFNLDQLTAMFAANNLSQADMIALSGKARQLLKSCLLTAPAIANPRITLAASVLVRKYPMCSVFLSCNPHKAGRKGLDSAC